MSGLLTILRKEWRCFLGGERSMFAVYGVIVLLWSLLFAGSGVAGATQTTVLWLLPFSVIVVSNFSQSAFVAERVNGAIEILLTCGIGRRTMMLAKMLFVAGLALAMGYGCMGLGAFWVWLADTNAMLVSATYPGWQDLAVFAAAVLLNSALSALFSVVLPNPRMTHFAIFFLMAAVLAVYYPLAGLSEGSVWMLGAGLAATAVGATLAALHAAGGERISRTVGL
jgi:hypothetical protein